MDVCIIIVKLMHVYSPLQSDTANMSASALQEMLVLQQFSFHSTLHRFAVTSFSLLFHIAVMYFGDGLLFSDVLCVDVCVYCKFIGGAMLKFLGGPIPSLHLFSPTLSFPSLPLEVAHLNTARRSGRVLL